MLTKVVQPGELFATVTSEGTFAGVFPNMPSKVFRARKYHLAVAIAATLESFRRLGSIAFGDASIVVGG